MLLLEAKNLLFYWAENATTAEKISMFVLTVIVLVLTKNILTFLDNFLESRVKEVDGSTAEKPTPTTSQKQRNNDRNAKVETDIAPNPKFPSKSSAMWWKGYSEDKIVSLDCEFVHSKKGTGMDRVKLATVAIWNFKGKKIYEGKAHHHPGSFVVDKHTFSINGFKKDSFLDGQKLKDVQDEVGNLLQNKLIIVFGGRHDFHCLNLDANDFDVFDLQTVYYSTMEHPKKGLVKEKHSLQSVYFHYFKEDLHKGIHTASADAKATMLVFRYGYQQDYETGSESWPDGRNDIKRLDVKIVLVPQSQPKSSVSKELVPV